MSNDAAGGTSRQGFIGRLLASRRWYSDTGSWVRALRHAGVQRGLPVGSRGSMTSVNMPGLEGPVFARLGTSDFAVIHEVLVENEYGPVLDVVPKDAGLIVDLGANVGISCRVWRRAFPRATVVCVEPDAGNFKVLEANAKAAGGDVRCVQVCVSDKPGTVQLMAGGAGEWAIRMAKEGEKGYAQVEAVRLDTLLDRLKLAGPIDLLKIDIEGAERALFEDRASAGWLSRVRVMVVELEELDTYSVEAFAADARRGHPGMDVSVLRDKGRAAIVIGRAA